jgi:hemerythrin-like domain-containing protein
MPSDSIATQSGDKSVDDSIDDSIEAGYLAAHAWRDGVGAVVKLNDHVRHQFGQQLTLMMKDHAESARQFAAMTPLPMVWLDHVNRRYRHITEGLSEFAEFAREELEARGQYQSQLWSPYLAGKQGEQREPSLPKPGANLLERLRRDHGHMARIMDAIDELSVSKSLTAPENLELLASAIEYVSEYPDAVHHPREDELFARLCQRDIDDDTREQIDAVKHSHAELGTMTRDLMKRFDALLEQADMDPEPLRASLKHYTEAQREHMRAEERHLFEPAAAILGPGDLRESESPTDPLFGEALGQSESRYEDLYRYVTRTV